MLGVWQRLLHVLKGLFAQGVRVAATVAVASVAVIAVTFALGLERGARNRVARAMRGFGPGCIMVVGQKVDGRMASWTAGDLQDLSVLFAGRAIVAPYKLLRLEMKAAGQPVETVIYAVLPVMSRVLDRGIAEGEMLSGDDEAGAALTCVLGRTTARGLFGDESPVGKKLLIGGKTFVVKGVLEAWGADEDGYDQDNVIWIPRATGFRYFKLSDRYTGFFVRALNPDATEAVARELAEALRGAQKQGTHGQDSFRLVTSSEHLRRLRGADATARKAAWTVAGAVLALGGSMLAWVLLLNVRQRRREIGLKRALGASKAAIAAESFLETTWVAVLGLAVGNLGAFAVVQGFRRFLPNLPVEAGAAAGTLASVAVLLLAAGLSVLPAARAAAVDPATLLSSGSRQRG